MSSLFNLKIIYFFKLAWKSYDLLCDFFSENITKDIEGVNMDEGLDPEVFHHIIQKMVYD